MGVIHKLRPEIKDFVLEQKKANPILSCRGLAVLIENKFQVKVSKSSINWLIKQAGLSMPIGRRPKKEKPKLQISIAPTPLLLEAKIPLEPPAAEAELPPAIKRAEEPSQTISQNIQPVPSEIQSTGAILLKAADHLIGGAYYITEAISKRLNLPGDGLFAKTESLIYQPLFKEDLSGLWPLIGQRLSLEDVLMYLDNLQSVKEIATDIMRIIEKSLQEVCCIKVDSLDGETFYLDGQLHTVWSTPYIPYDFSATIHNIKSYINSYFYEDKPFVLFMAPGYETPTKEFFNFILSLNSLQKRISKFTLYNYKFQELEVMALRQAKRHFFIVGAWPWQFVEYRQVNKIGEFKPFYLKAIKKEFYVAEVELTFSQPLTNQSVIIRGAALKTKLDEKTRLIILSNFSEEVSPEELSDIYLARWPNLEEAFQDHSRKIELFTYTGSPQRLFSAESLNLDPGNSLDIKQLFASYLKALDLYVKLHFLPEGLEAKDVATMKEQFYSLPATLKEENGRTEVVFQPAKNFLFLKELEYACRRLNEREIKFRGASKAWFAIWKALS